MHAREKKAVFKPGIRETPEQVAKRRRLVNESNIVNPPDDLSIIKDSSGYLVTTQDNTQIEQMEEESNLISTQSNHVGSKCPSDS